MSNLGKLLRGMRVARRLDVAAMSSALGTSPRRLELVEEGAVFPPSVERRAWAKSLGFASLGDFDDQWRNTWAVIGAAARDGLVPVVNKVPAGPPVDYEAHGIDSRTGFEYVPRPDGCDGENLFAVVVVGDSMTPVYRDGDLVVFRPVSPDEDTPDGTPVFVRFGSRRKHCCTFKNLYRRPDGRFDLIPENPRHERMTAGPDEIDRMAVAIDRRAGFIVSTPSTRLVADEYAQDFPDD